MIQKKLTDDEKEELGKIVSNTIKELCNFADSHSLNRNDIIKDVTRDLSMLAKISDFSQFA